MSVAFSHWRCGRDYQIVDAGRLEDVTLFVSGNSRAIRVSRDLGERLRAGLEAMNAIEAAEWNLLADNGIVSEANIPVVREARISDGANLAINVNLTSVCNLGCTYCFADGGDYGRISGKLEGDIADDIFRFVQDRLHGEESVRFEFFGGEPLLNFERISAMCARAEAVSNETGIKFIHRISTNLTVLPEGALELFARHGFIVSVSIDGCRETHDRNRPTKGGRGSWDRIIANCRAVRAAGDDITLVARMTVMGGDPGMKENVRALWDMNLFDYFQIYPGVVPRSIGQALDAKNGNFGQGTMAADFLDQLAEFVDGYSDLFNPDNRFRGVLEYERIADMVLRGKAALSFCSGGRNYFTFSPDHSIMPCHRLVGDTALQSGDSRTGIDATTLHDWRMPIDDHPVCSGCWIRYICGGGCKQENLQATGSLNSPSAEGCRHQIQLVENVVGMLAAQDDSYRMRDRSQLDDLFVSCGRPVMLNFRNDAESPPLQHFQPL
ncbi:SPASM domain-containing protein [Bradyrhizobium ontarionense]|uniref:SPASM domain-containing protein n=1 Tax=Bradyrhizobium ontarionense TaxID=2898149 RepID=A0ABY3R974_9BRAD|nr:radical SAM protein [Bradyrhizobium sp. A19]UFZ03307.1 SPASM domain-containing protein [Bradyrhizobium sp. A19]